MLWLPLSATTALSAGGAGSRRGAATTAAAPSTLQSLHAAELFTVETESSPKPSPRVQRTSLDTLLQTCHSKRAVFLGEHHDAPSDHLLQAALIRAVRPSRGAMAIGLEAVQWRFQPALDAYVAGELSENELEAAVQWRTRWAWPFEACAPIFRACRELTAAGLPTPLLALNADSEDWARVVQGGFPSLERTALSRYVPDAQGFSSFGGTAAFETYVSSTVRPSYETQPMRISRRTPDGQQLELDIPFPNFFLGRLLWDEAMASAAAAWCTAHPRGLLVGLLGTEHVKFGCGVPGRCGRQIGGIGAVATVLLNPTAADTTDAAPLARALRSDGRVDFAGYTLQLRFAAADGDGAPPVLDAAASDRVAAFAAAQTHSPSSAVLGLADFLLFSAR